MAKSKHSFGRYQVIDREMRRKDWVKTKELKDIIENELSINVSERMINEDINSMRYDPLLGYDAPIEYNKLKKAYYYSDKNYTIKAFGLKEDDINALSFYAKTINQYREYEVFKDFTDAIEKVLDAVTIRKGISNAKQARSIVQTEQMPRLSGNELIPLIVQALDTNKVLEFEYQKFNDPSPKTVKFQPHLLKESKHRWYIVGSKGVHCKPTTVYAMDRIVALRVLDEMFTPLVFDFDQHFTHSFGITVEETNPVEVILSFTPWQGNYLKTLKIHPTQKTLIDDEVEYRIAIFVIPSWEFYEKILGYGNSVKVISPSCVVEEIKTKSRQIFEQYQ